MGVGVTLPEFSEWTLIIMCSFGEEPAKITKEASGDKFQIRFLKNVQANSEN